MKIVLLEDTYVLREQISEYLTLLGHHVTTCKEGNAFLELKEYYTYDLFILDLNVPNYSGLEILEYLRKQNILTPVVIITASADIVSMRRSYEYGCLEYIKKPFSLEELEVRIDRFLKQSCHIVALTHGYIFDKTLNELLKESETVNLTKLQKKIILFLLSNRGRVCSAIEIIENITPEKLIDTTTLVSHIKNIRKLTVPTFITTVRSEGYRID